MLSKTIKHSIRLKHQTYLLIVPKVVSEEVNSPPSLNEKVLGIEYCTLHLYLKDAYDLFRKNSDRHEKNFRSTKDEDNTIHMGQILFHTVIENRNRYCPEPIT